MTRAFERILRTFSDEDLMMMAREGAGRRAPYWGVMGIALHIELERRGLGEPADPTPDKDSTGPGSTNDRSGGRWGG